MHVTADQGGEGTSHGPNLHRCRLKRHETALRDVDVCHVLNETHRRPDFITASRRRRTVLPRMSNGLNDAHVGGGNYVVSSPQVLSACGINSIQSSVNRHLV